MATVSLALPYFGLKAAGVENRICGRGAMAELVREHDWARTSLGPIAGWSETLVGAVNLVLASPVPSTLYWGAELLMIYNDPYRLVAGTRHPGALGRRAAEVWAEAWPVIGCQFTETFSKGSTVQQDGLLVPIEKDGRMQDIYWNYSISPVYEGSRIAGLYNTCVDVTASLSTASHLDEVVKRLDEVLTSTSDGVAVIDRNWCVTYMNRVAEQANAGIPGMVGKNLWESLPELDNKGTPDRYHYERAMYQGIEGEFESYYPEPLNHWLHIRVTPAAEGIVIFFQDITAAKLDREEAAKASRAMRLSEEELRWTVALSAQMPWVADAYGGIMRLDDTAESAGERSVAPTTGDDWKRMVHPDDIEKSVEEWNHSVLTGTPYDREQRVLTRDGTYRWFRSRARPRRDEAGRIVKWYGTNEDIEQRKLAEESLRTSEKLAAVGRLASSIAHEINNPLEAVTNLVFLARTSDDVPAEVLGYLEMAERELKRASTITSQTLRFHRQSSKQTEVEFGEMVDEVLNLVHGRLLKSMVETEVRLRTTRTIRCFEGEIRQVVLNLVMNSADALHGCGGGRLLVRTREATDWRTGRRGVTMTLADTGPGMPLEVRARIFDPFFTTKGAAGTGLGLWVSREIVARHMGVLRLRTRPASGEDGKSGCGCVFTLFLPEDAVERPARRWGDAL